MVPHAPLPPTPSPTTWRLRLRSFYLARLEEFNNPPEYLAASITAPAISYSMLESASQAFPDYRLLHSAIQAGLSDDSKDWDPKLLPHFCHR